MLDSIVSKDFFSEDGVTKIKFNEKIIVYSPEFKLLMTSQLHSPHYSPDICIKLAVIDFSVTFQGLEEQMLVDVINNLEPHVETRRDNLMV